MEFEQDSAEGIMYGKGNGIGTNGPTEILKLPECAEMEFNPNLHYAGWVKIKPMACLENKNAFKKAKEICEKDSERIVPLEYREFVKYIVTPLDWNSTGGDVLDPMGSVAWKYTPKKWGNNRTDPIFTIEG